MTKRILICDDDSVKATLLARAHAENLDVNILTVEEATEQGINVTDVIMHSTLKLEMPIIMRRDDYPLVVDDNKGRKGHQRPYKYHR